MFHQHDFIEKTHHVALESCVRNHNTVTPALLTRLYRMALSTLTQETTEKTDDVLGSYLKTPDNTRLAAYTDRKTGVYLQLASNTANPDKIFLTVGQKWAMEQANPANSNTATLIW